MNPRLVLAKTDFPFFPADLNLFERHRETALSCASELLRLLHHWFAKEENQIQLAEATNMKMFKRFRLGAVAALVSLVPSIACSATMEEEFLNPPDAARPGVYWYFMDGNLDRDEMIRDLDAMKEAGLGHVVHLEVNVDVPRGPVVSLSPRWLEMFRDAVRHAEKIGIGVTIGMGPGWTGSGGPWIKEEESMQHLVFSETSIKGPVRFREKLPVAPQRDKWWKMLECDFYQDVAVHAFPASKPTIDNAVQKAFYSRAHYSAGEGTAFFPAPANHAETPVDALIAPEKIIDLTDKLAPDGTLAWDVPPGEWTVLRFGRRSNGTSNRPASLPVVGLDHDKFDRKLLEKHFDHYGAKLIAAAGLPAAGSTGGLQAMHLDSWEMNAQNWNPRLLDEFQKRRGYDFTPFLATFSGRVVRDRSASERALWDLRLTIHELILENYAGHLRTLAHRHGIKLSIEPYGLTQTADLDLGSLADVPMGEFWSTKYEFADGCISAASVAHALGKPVVAAESFTGHRDERGRSYPWSLKNQANWALAIGINQFQFHTFTHQALGEKGLPGMTMGAWGVRWDRGQTWWPMVGAFHRYLARSSQLLRQGTAVSDVLYLTPEGAPNAFHPPTSALAGSGLLPDKKGYSFDGGSPSWLKSMVVEDGRIGITGGSFYQLLVLPRFETMTPALLKDVIRLVEDGATVVGYPPSASPSLVDFPACDEEVKHLAQSLWGKPPYAAGREVGNGRIVLDEGAAEFFSNNPTPNFKKGGDNIYPDYKITAALLEKAGIPEDFQSDHPLRFTHRRAATTDIYFVANPADKTVSTTATFRINDGMPRLWDPVTGEIRILPQFERQKESTRVPLTFAPHQGYFIVFVRNKKSAPTANPGHVNFPEANPLLTLDGPWQLAFDPQRGGPERITFPKLLDWTTHEERGIKYYSGIATYRKSFTHPVSSTAQTGRLFLDLGAVHDIASVRFNGKELGIVWCAPWQVEVTHAIRDGENQLEIEVANRWSNRQLGDTQAPDKDARTLRWDNGMLGGKEFKTGRYTFSTGPALGQLLPSGLIGPVTLRRKHFMDSLSEP